MCVGMWDVGVANKQENESHSEMHFKSCRVQKLLPACVTVTIWSPDLAPVFFLWSFFPSCRPIWYRNYKMVAHLNGKLNWTIQKRSELNSFCLLHWVAHKNLSHVQRNISSVCLGLSRERVRLCPALFCSFQSNFKCCLLCWIVGHCMHESCLCCVLFFATLAPRSSPTFGFLPGNLNWQWHWVKLQHTDTITNSSMCAHTHTHIFHTIIKPINLDNTCNTCQISNKFGAESSTATPNLAYFSLFMQLPSDLHVLTLSIRSSLIFVVIDASSLLPVTLSSTHTQVYNILCILRADINSQWFWLAELRGRKARDTLSKVARTQSRGEMKAESRTCVCVRSAQVCRMLKSTVRLQGA